MYTVTENLIESYEDLIKFEEKQSALQVKLIKDPSCKSIVESFSLTNTRKFIKKAVTVFLDFVRKYYAKLKYFLAFKRVKILLDKLGRVRDVYINKDDTLLIKSLPQLFADPSIVSDYFADLRSFTNTMSKTFDEMCSGLADSKKIKKISDECDRFFGTKAENYTQFIKAKGKSVDTNNIINAGKFYSNLYKTIQFLMMNIQAIASNLKTVGEFDRYELEGYIETPESAKEFSNLCVLYRRTINFFIINATGWLNVIMNFADFYMDRREYFLNKKG